MQTILVAGAGKSSSYLIHYLLTNAHRNKWKVIIADKSISSVSDKVLNNNLAQAIEIDITDNAKREDLVKQADIVLSLLPPSLHILLAKDCLKYKKNLITSSYISDEMKAMDADVKEAGLMFMCEMGLDPGIDHMTASKIIQSIQRVAGTITGFKSYCGGLIAPESDDNPWHYKFTWNPMNVIMAGTGGSKYLLSGKHLELPYEKLFDGNKKLKITDLGTFAWYPNRDSLRYLDLYELTEARTFIRATLRSQNFVKGWNMLITLGLTKQNDSFDSKIKTLADWVKKVTNCPASKSIIKHVAEILNVPEDDKVLNMLKWLGIFEEKPIKSSKMSSAEILLSVLLEKWDMKPEDKDMVIMQHEFDYNHKGEKVKLTSTMVIKGDNKEYSAMAKTVGLPIGILAKFVLAKKIVIPHGVVIPNMSAVYRPLLTELAHYGIVFNEEVE